MHVAVGGQLHCLQSGNPKNPGLQRVHWRPITFGLQGHWPPNFSHSYLKYKIWQTKNSKVQIMTILYFIDSDIEVSIVV